VGCFEVSSMVPIWCNEEPVNIGNLADSLGKSVSAFSWILSLTSVHTSNVVLWDDWMRVVILNIVWLLRQGVWGGETT